MEGIRLVNADLLLHNIIKILEKNNL